VTSTINLFKQRWATILGTVLVGLSLTVATPVGATGQSGADTNVNNNNSNRNVNQNVNQLSQSQSQTSAAPPPTTPPRQPAAPRTLANTGPGSLAGLFVLASLAGTLGFRRHLAYRR
jgi:hypothetical protein